MKNHNKIDGLLDTISAWDLVKWKQDCQLLDHDMIFHQINLREDHAPYLRQLVASIAAQVRSQVNSYGIYGGKSSIGQIFWVWFKFQHTLRILK
jgi:hypothetical protein